MGALKSKLCDEKNFPCLSAVAGPAYCRLAFLMLCLVGFLLFVVSLIPKLGEWQENKVSTEQTVLDEVDYPDMYFCFSAQDRFLLENWPLPNTIPTGYSLPGTGEFNAMLASEKHDPSVEQYGSASQSSMQRPADARYSCELNILDDSYVKNLGCAGDSLSASDDGISAAHKKNLEALEAARSRDLHGKEFENNIRHTAGEVQKAACAVFKIKDSVKAKRTAARPEYIIWEGRLLNAYNQDITLRESSDSPGDSKEFPTGTGMGVNGYNNVNGRSVEVYYTQKGVSPVVDGLIVAPMSLIPLGGVQFISSLSFREVKDKTKGDKDFRREYIVDAFQVQLRQRKDLNKLTMVFRVIDFHVQKVTISKYSFGDVWADLGGLWAASLIVIAFFFGKSGRINQNGHELQIFKYLPESTRKKHLEGSQEKPEDTKDDNL